MEESGMFLNLVVYVGLADDGMLLLYRMKKKNFFTAGINLILRDNFDTFLIVGPLAQTACLALYQTRFTI